MAQSALQRRLIHPLTHTFTPMGAAATQGTAHPNGSHLGVLAKDALTDEEREYWITCSAS